MAQLKSFKDYRFEMANKALDETTRAKVLELWQNQAGLDPQEAIRRIEELILIVRTADGSLAGVSTAARVHIPQLRNDLFAYRCFIDEKFRAPALDTMMLVKCKNYLEEISLQEEKPCIGLIMIVQNETIKQYWRQAVWPGADMIYIGNTPQGHHMRVSYFKGARI